MTRDEAKELLRLFLAGRPAAPPVDRRAMMRCLIRIRDGHDGLRAR